MSSQPDGGEGVGGGRSAGSGQGVDVDRLNCVAASLKQCTSTRVVVDSVSAFDCLIQYLGYIHVEACNYFLMHCW